MFLTIKSTGLVFMNLVNIYLDRLGYKNKPRQHKENIEVIGCRITYKLSDVDADQLFDIN